MDFQGIDISTCQGASEARITHRRLVRDYMALLDRYRKLPACEDLVYAGLLQKGYQKEFLDSLETFTCLPPPGDPLYLGEDSPFALQYDEMLDRMGRDQEECMKQDQEYFDSLSEEEQNLGQAMSMVTAMTNTFFMLSLDWGQVSVSGSLPFCTPRVQIEMLGYLGAATGACRCAFDRMNQQLRECAVLQIQEACAYAEKIRRMMQGWREQYPRFAEALQTRAKLLEQTEGNLKILLKYVEGKTKGIGK